MSKLEKFKSLLAELLADQTEDVKMSSMTTDKGVLAWDGEDDLKQGDAVYIMDEAGEKTVAADGEYATEDIIVVVAEGKVAEIKDKPAEGEEQKPEPEENPEGEQQMAENNPEGEGEQTESSLEDRVAKIESILEQIMDYFGILRLQKDEVEKLRAEIETIKKTPAADPAHKEFKKLTKTEATGNEKIDNLRKLMES